MSEQKNHEFVAKLEQIPGTTEYRIMLYPDGDNFGVCLNLGEKDELRDTRDKMKAALAGELEVKNLDLCRDIFEMTVALIDKLFEEEST